MNSSGEAPFVDIARDAINGSWERVIEASRGSSERSLFAATLVAKQMVQDGRFGEAVTELRRVLASATSARTRTDARILLGGAFRLRGNSKKAESEFLGAIHEAGTDFDFCNATNLCASFLWGMFLYPEARDRYAESVERASGARLDIELFARVRVAHCEVEIGRRDQATLQLSVVSSRVGDIDPDIALQVNRHLTLVAGIVDRDMTKVDEALAEWASIGASEFVMRCIESRARVQIESGDFPGAAESTQELSEIAVRCGSQFFLDRASLLTARLFGEGELCPDVEALVYSVRDPATLIVMCGALHRSVGDALLLEVARDAGRWLSEDAYCKLRNRFFPLVEHPATIG